MLKKPKLAPTDLFAGERSSQWPKVRKAYVKLHPVCELTGIGKDLNVHHIRPFQYFPELELDKSNFITLTNADVWGLHYGMHILVGHLGNFKYYNPNLRKDIEVLKTIRSTHKTFEQVQGEINDYVEEMLKTGRAFNKEMKQMIIDTGGLEEGKGLSKEQRFKVEELIKKYYKEDEKGVENEKNSDYTFGY